MFQLLGRFVSRYWYLVIGAWLAVAITLKLVAPSWDSVTNDGDLAYLPADMTTVRAEKLLTAAFPENKTKSQMVIVAARTDGELADADFDVLTRLSQYFEAKEAPKDAAQKPGAPNSDSPIVDVWNPDTEVVGSKLVSETNDRGQAALVVISLNTEFMAAGNIPVLHQVEGAIADEQKRPDFPKGLKLGITGSAAVGGDTLDSAMESVSATEKATIFLVLIILLLVYRAPALVVIPLATIGCSLVVATCLVALLTQLHLIHGFEWLDYKVFKTTRIFIIVILFGSGTDFCLFLISRFREELERGHDRTQAVSTALATVGDALAASAFTTICGLGMMFFASFGKFKNSGPTIAVCLFITLIACLTLAPALLRMMGKVVFWPFKQHGRAPEQGLATSDEQINRFWDWASRRIIARPGLILITAVVLLSPLAAFGWKVPISYDLVRELTSTRPSVIGTRLLRDYFPAGDTGPLTVLANRKGFDFGAREGRQLIRDLTKEIYDIDPKIVSVRSLEYPLGEKPRRTGIDITGQTARRHPRTKATYLSQGAYGNSVTRFDIVMAYDPFSPEALDLFEKIEQNLEVRSKDAKSPWRGSDFDYLGTTAGTRDLKVVVGADQVRIQQLVVIAVLGVLLILLRRPLICLYLILSVVFSYYVTIGTTLLVFSHVYADFGGLDWKVPLYLFVILVAVGEDYNILLAHRVFEEQAKRGPMEGLRVGTAKTGGIITSCGIIMAGTFISMMTGSLRAMLELGFALSFGVMLDTMIVRPVLVPAFLAILFRRDKSPTPPAAAAKPENRPGPKTLAERPERASSQSN